MSVSNEVLALISQVAQKQVSANEELLSTGLIDSVSAMDLVMAIKQKFDVDLPLENCPITAIRGGSFRVSISKFRLSFISSLACRLGSFSSFTSLASSPLKSLVKTLKYLAL